MQAGARMGSVVSSTVASASRRCPSGCLLQAMSVDASSHSHPTGSLWLSISLRSVRSIPARRRLIRDVRPTMRINVQSDVPRYWRLFALIVGGTVCFGSLPWFVGTASGRTQGFQTVVFTIAAMTALVAIIYRPRGLTLVGDAVTIEVTDDAGRGAWRFLTSEVCSIRLTPNGHILSHPLYWLCVTLESCERTIGPILLTEHPPLRLQTEIERFLDDLRLPELQR